MKSLLIDAPNYPALCQLLLEKAKDPQGQGGDHGTRYDYLVSFYRLHYSFRADGTIDALYWVGKCTVTIVRYKKRKQQWVPSGPLAAVMAWRVLLHVWMHEAVESTGANVSDIMMFFRKHGDVLLQAENSIVLWNSIKEHYVLTGEWTIALSDVKDVHAEEVELLF